MRLYVGNVSPTTSRWQLRMAFEMYGQVSDICIEDKPRDAKAYGFCVVEMPFDKQAARAISELNGKELGGNKLTIKEHEAGL